MLAFFASISLGALALRSSRGNTLGRLDTANLIPRGEGQARPLGLEFDPTKRPKIRALLDGLDDRHSFIANPIWWWDPDVVGYSVGGETLRHLPASFRHQR